MLIIMECRDCYYRTTEISNKKITLLNNLFVNTKETQFNLFKSK